MIVIAPRSAGDNRKYPTGDGEAERFDHLADLFVKTVVAEAAYIDAGREFLDAAAGLDQRGVVDAIAGKFIRTFPKVDPDEARTRIWRDVGRQFGWHDVAELAPEGSA